ncbi:MAG: 4-hydroxy-tetrahydrodipicolinate reductase [Verrucomicrobia bacterium]|nr:4-hydroxy-tetrahydrodipicolinate reductase [Verrucomicrobiota bacterium]
MITVAILGAAGRMGGALIRCSRQIKDVRVVAAVEHPGNRAIGKDAGALAGLDGIGVDISDDPRSVAVAEVVIDFTLHNSTPEYAKLCASLGRPMIIGSTGLNEQETAVVKDAAKKIPIVWTPNMSLGVNLMFSLVRKAASVLGSSYRVEISETHHVHKKDAPSGTALRLGQKVADGRGDDFRTVMVHNPVDRSGGEGKIIIHSFREGEVVGDHTVKFENSGERIEFTHHAESRDAFALGALHAAKWVVGRKPGIYDMQDVLGL